MRRFFIETRIAVVLCVVACLPARPGTAAGLALTSPDKRIAVAVEVAERLRWSASFDGKPILKTRRCR